jgi:hypothetical protein
MFGLLNWFVVYVIDTRVEIEGSTTAGSTKMEPFRSGYRIRAVDRTFRGVLSKPCLLPRLFSLVFDHSD